MAATTHESGNPSIEQTSVMVATLRSDPGASNIITENPAGISDKLPSTAQMTVVTETIILARVGVIGGSPFGGQGLVYRCGQVPSNAIALAYTNDHITRGIARHFRFARIIPSLPEKSSRHTGRINRSAMNKRVDPCFWK